MIFIEREPPLSRIEVEEKMLILHKAIKLTENTIESSVIKQAMKSVVNTYCDPDEINCNVPADIYVPSTKWEMELISRNEHGNND